MSNSYGRIPSKNRRSALSKIGKVGSQTRPLWQPLHRSPAYGNLKAGECSVAGQLNWDALSLPCSVGISHDEIRAVIRSVKSPAA